MHKDPFPIIKKLELSLLNPEVRKSAQQLKQLIADEFMEFGSSGKIYNKKDILKALPQETPREFKVEDFKVTRLSEEAMLATYKTIEKKKTVLRSSIWKKFRDNWCIVFHQGTKV